MLTGLTRLEDPEVTVDSVIRVPTSWAPFDTRCAAAALSAILPERVKAKYDSLVQASRNATPRYLISLRAIFKLIHDDFARNLKGTSGAAHYYTMLEGLPTWFGSQGWKGINQSLARWDMVVAHLKPDEQQKRAKFYLCLEALRSKCAMVRNYLEHLELLNEDNPENTFDAMYAKLLMTIQKEKGNEGRKSSSSHRLQRAKLLLRNERRSGRKWSMTKLQMLQLRRRKMKRRQLQQKLQLQLPNRRLRKISHAFASSNKASATSAENANILMMRSTERTSRRSQTQRARPNRRLSPRLPLRQESQAQSRSYATSGKRKMQGRR